MAAKEQQWERVENEEQSKLAVDLEEHDSRMMERFKAIYMGPHE